MLHSIKNLNELIEFHPKILWTIGLITLVGLYLITLIIRYT